jgi:hypothetical protein
MVRTVLLVAAAALIGTPASAGNPSAQAQPGAKSDRPEDKIICRYINTTGSRLSRNRQCMTRAQWDLDADATREQIEQQEKRATGEATNPPH